MATKTFSGRVDGQALAYADEIARREFGVSFGQYCSSTLIEIVKATHTLPKLERTDEESQRRARASALIRGFSSLPHDEAIGRMSDDELKDLIASRYE